MAENEEIFPYIKFGGFKDSKIIEAVPEAFYMHVVENERGDVSHINIAIPEGSRTDQGGTWRTMYDGKQNIENLITACQYILKEYYDD